MTFLSTVDAVFSGVNCIWSLGRAHEPSSNLLFCAPLCDLLGGFEYDSGSGTLIYVEPRRESPLSNPLTIAQIQSQHPREWGSLAPQQKLFVEAWINTADATKAIYVAYPKLMNSKIETMRVARSHLLANLKIRKIIALRLGFSKTEMVLDEAKVLLKRARRKGNNNTDVLVMPLLRLCEALTALQESQPNYQKAEG